MFFVQYLSLFLQKTYSNTRRRRSLYIQLQRTGTAYRPHEVIARHGTARRPAACNLRYRTDTLTHSHMHRAYTLYHTHMLSALTGDRTQGGWRVRRVPGRRRTGRRRGAGGGVRTDDTNSTCIRYQVYKNSRAKRHLTYSNAQSTYNLVTPLGPYHATCSRQLAAASPYPLQNILRLRQRSRHPPS